MTETTDTADKAPKKRPGGLNGMLLADLKAMAGAMGIPGAGSMKKAQLVEAIKAAGTPVKRASKPEPKAEPDTQPTLLDQPAEAQAPAAEKPRRTRAPKATAASASEGESAQQPQQPGQPEQPEQSGPVDQTAAAEQKPKSEREPKSEPEQGDQNNQQPHQQDGQPHQQDGQGDQQGDGQGDQQGEGEGRSGRNRRRRGRDRNRNNQDGPQQGNQGGNQQGNQGGSNQGGQGNQGNQQNQGGQGGNQQGQRGNRHEPDTTILEDDIVVPAAGILDVLDNYAFVRTSGYLPGPDDVYLSLSMVRKFGLRRGDAIVGQVRHPREGERREKFNPMVRIDTVNGHDPETARTRADFAKLTPLHPSERLRLETGAADTVGRVLDVAAPLGKGARGLVLSPPAAGKTTMLQSIAASVSANNPECHLMVVLVDERPEEVTDFGRSVKGEVIASTFDRPAADHVTVAELSIERAKRLVELGHDVVVLLDGLTRLGRAYTMAQPATGRVLRGGVDAAALHPPKSFFGAARNVENGGSLTIIATAALETGSELDEAILEEFQGTGNLVIRLRRELADARLFPAVDVAASGTRREDLLLGPEELATVWKLRRALSALDGPRALERLLDRLGSTHSNVELLTQIQRAPQGGAGQEI